MASPKNSSSLDSQRYEYIVSACLAGLKSTYTGSHKMVSRIRDLVKCGRALAVCPEIMGGLGVPREGAEILDGDGSAVLTGKARVLTVSGRDVSAHYVKGAKAAALLAKKYNISKAILKSNSPACGSGRIYDGSFCDVLKKGDGVLTAMLKNSGLKVRRE